MEWAGRFGSDVAFYLTMSGGRRQRIQRPPRYRPAVPRPGISSVATHLRRVWVSITGRNCRRAELGDAEVVLAANPRPITHTTRPGASRTRVFAPGLPPASIARGDVRYATLRLLLGTICLLMAALAATSGHRKWPQLSPRPSRQNSRSRRRRACCGAPPGVCPRLGWDRLVVVARARDREAQKSRAGRVDHPSTSRAAALGRCTCRTRAEDRKAGG